MNILTIIGARPQFIKAATISRQITKTDTVTEYIVHTGQHYDDNMSEVFFSELDIPTPNKNLRIGSGSHGEQTAQMLIGIEKEIIEQSPSCVLVYGDTNSTIAGALAASKLNVPVCHVEAGLRSHNRKMPEEINRILTDHASNLLFAPTKNAFEQLVNEGIPEHNITLSGDVMLDAALYYGKKARHTSDVIKNLKLSNSVFILATVHRAENTDDKNRLKRIIHDLELLAINTCVIMPIHPRTRKKLAELDISTKNILIIEPVGYMDMVMLESRATLIITDSGGVQKEAFFHQKPCITLRTETEWSELVEAGWNSLFPPVPENTESLTSRVENMIKSTTHLFTPPLYGEGNAAQKIITSILTHFG